MHMDAWTHLSIDFPPPSSLPRLPFAVTDPSVNMDRFNGHDSKMAFPGGRMHRLPDVSQDLRKSHFARRRHLTLSSI